MEWIVIFGFCTAISIFCVMVSFDTVSRILARVMLVISLFSFGLSIYGYSMGAFDKPITEVTENVK